MKHVGTRDKRVFTHRAIGRNLLPNLKARPGLHIRG
jgi:hypothetical protein